MTSHVAGHEARNLGEVFCEFLKELGIRLLSLEHSAAHRI